ncbi:MAG: hypothetical protein AAB441_03540 [Patescibacteria group bacterium]
MAKAWRRVLEKSEAENKKRVEWEEGHPPITRISVEEADRQRTLQTIGREAVACDLPCHGNYIPKEYSHTRGMVNVFRRDIIVEGWEKPQEGQPTYFGLICALTLRRICVAKDETLRKAVER